MAQNNNDLPEDQKEPSDGTSPTPNVTPGPSPTNYDAPFAENPYAGVFMGNSSLIRFSSKTDSPPAAPPPPRPSQPVAPSPPVNEAPPPPPVNPTANKVGRLDTIFSRVSVPRGSTPANTYLQAPVVVQQDKAVVSGKVFHDLPTGPDGIPNVVLTLTGITDAGKKATFATTTDEFGSYCFQNVAPGRYTLTRLPPDGFVGGIHRTGTVNGSPSGKVVDDRLEEIILPPNSVASGYDFAELLPVAIKGVVWGASAELDEATGEFSFAGVEGFELELTGEDHRGRAVSVTTKSGPEGRYTLDELVPGTYCLRLKEVHGYRPVEARVGDHGGEAYDADGIEEICLTAGETGVAYDFYCQGTARVTGKVVVRPRVGARPMPLPGVEISLTGKGSHDRIAQRKAMTDGRGNYHFTDLPPGLYRVQVVPPEGWDLWVEAPGKVDGRDSGRAVPSAMAIDAIDLRQGGTAQNMDFIAGLPAS